MTIPGDPLLITVAPTGAETAKADCPQLPTTLEELVATAVACEAAGAAMIHVHIRDDEHRPTLDGAAPQGHGRRRSARAPTWSSSSPPAARCTTRSTSGSRCSTPSPTPAA